MVCTVLICGHLWPNFWVKLGAETRERDSSQEFDFLGHFTASFLRMPNNRRPTVLDLVSCVCGNVQCTMQLARESRLTMSRDFREVPFLGNNDAVTT